ncbi:beta-galactosidase [Microbacterium sp. RURRCA19A]|uniref:beta-galactosidase n=1 Tax=Microbacterium sp. RURRCA19A TaxID=1907391 RepID=UPI000956F0A7|nr:beta-galactosidase [Microbacterium sp. RURRCA19A]SIR96908.1 beta-galactosidase [Microbacterium sp. RURRCA19A]
MTLAPTLYWSSNRFWRNGLPTRVIAGSMHYFRVHPGQWADRLQRLADLGVTSVDTYVAWNFHQPSAAAEPDFSGWRDIEHFLSLAASAGLDAIVRPGPYICAEWSNGGYPVWFTAGARGLRTGRPDYLDEVARWFDVLLPRLVPLQAAHGGPIIAFQAENEFGSFGDDPRAVAAIATLLRERGVTELIYTADGPTPGMLDAGAVDGILTALTLGSRAADARALARTRRPEEPFFAAEYWSGWFDHWGENHHVRSPESAAGTLADILADHGSVSIYMAHGGTNFGTWAGANVVDGVLAPTVTSYDSDAPIAEDGTLTPKFHALRAVLGVDRTIESVVPTFLPPSESPLAPTAGTLATARSLAGDAVPAGAVLSFDEAGMPGALGLYEADVRTSEDSWTLTVTRVADRGSVYLDGIPVGDVEGEGTLTLSTPPGTHRLSILVENVGRVNYGPLIGAAKGLLGPVLVDRRQVQGWDLREVRIEATDAETLASVSDGRPDRSGLAVATLDVETPADAHLRIPGARRALVWVNDLFLGRLDERGPQHTLYVPAPAFRAGRNTVAVWDLVGRPKTVVVSREAELGPPEEYIETF